MKYNSEQEVFDAVVKHAEQMTKPSVSDTGECLYRSKDGGKCLVGALIEDKDYCSNMDEGEGMLGSAVYDLAMCGLLPVYLTDYVKLLGYCQRAHDRDVCLPTNLWKDSMIKNLKELAYKYNLQYNGVL